ncbi:MAG: hypothetical protein NC911_05050 [Candidatus Omnitrophica bacterium]|nr:hypothetical protein [Candidatus Omnitrophota bacterium]
MAKEQLRQLLSLIETATDQKGLAQSRKRQEAVWLGKESDYLPWLLTGPVPERGKFPHYNLREQFYDPEKMLWEQLWTALAVLRGKSDAVPSVRVSFGTGFLASVFGLKQMVFPDKMPWLQERLSKKQILALSPEKLEPIEEKGLMPECHRYIKIYQDYLKGTVVRIYLPDTQGVFDLAHLVYGDDLFYQLYDDFSFVEHLLTLTAYVYRRASEIIKGWIGEPATAGFHGGTLYLAGCGVRSCEDTTTLISPGLVEKVLPIALQAVAPFGGWFHFCGDGRTLLDKLLQAREVRGINFGNPEKYDWITTLQKIASAGKVYSGSIPRKEGENLVSYCRRVVSYLPGKGNLILTGGLFPGEDPGEAVAVWQTSQEERFNSRIRGRCKTPDHSRCSRGN